MKKLSFCFLFLMSLTLTGYAFSLLEVEQQPVMPISNVTSPEENKIENLKQIIDSLYQTYGEENMALKASEDLKCPPDVIFEALYYLDYVDHLKPGMKLPAVPEYVTTIVTNKPINEAELQELRSKGYEILGGLYNFILVKADLLTFLNPQTSLKNFDWITTTMSNRRVVDPITRWNDGYFSWVTAIEEIKAKNPDIDEASLYPLLAEKFKIPTSLVKKIKNWIDKVGDDPRKILKGTPRVKLCLKLKGDIGNEIGYENLRSLREAGYRVISYQKDTIIVDVDYLTLINTETNLKRFNWIKTANEVS